jgi:hypothetical protein
VCKKVKIAKWLAALALATAPGAIMAARSAPVPSERSEAVFLSWFGERPAFSPDGKRIAFVDKEFGDAFEIEIETRKLRNLTGHLPHQGIVRVQYLPNGDYLLIAPRIHVGPETRFKGTLLWVLDRGLERGLMPLDQLVMEGVAVSTRENRIAYAEFPGNNPGNELFTADIIYEGGTPRLANKRRIPREANCVGEPQDFRRADREVTFTCYSQSKDRGNQAGVYGVDIASGRITRYRDVPDEYNEVEGISPDGSWTTVECGERITPSTPRVAICKLELTRDGFFGVLMKGSPTNPTLKANNPVISPDGRWMAFSSSDFAYAPTQPGARSDGILLLDLAGTPQ